MHIPSMRVARFSVPVVPFFGSVRSSSFLRRVYFSRHRREFLNLRRRENVKELLVVIRRAIGDRRSPTFNTDTA